jgi:predicted nucleic acid-binding protein
MILVDTSVWIRFLAGTLDGSDAQHMRTLLSQESVAGHEFIFGELLIGDKGGRRAVLDAYQHTPFAPVVGHADVASFVRKRKLHGHGLGWIDAHLLASSLAAGWKLWTLDKSLRHLATVVGVGYR